MNLQELEKWAAENQKRNNMEFQAAGVAQNNIHVVKCHLMMIIDRVKKITFNTTKNNSYLENINESLLELAKRGLPGPAKENEPNIVQDGQPTQPPEPLPSEQPLLRPEPEKENYVNVPHKKWHERR